MSSLSNGSGKLSWIGGNKKRQGAEQLAFPCEEPVEEQLLSPPKSPGRLRRILSSSKLTSWVNNNTSPNAASKIDTDALADRKARPRYHSASRSFFGRGSKIAPLSPNLSNASTPDLSPSTSSSSSFTSAASSTATSPGLEYPPQIKLEAVTPWSIDLEEVVFPSTALQAALPIIETPKPQSDAIVQETAKPQQTILERKSLWEISSDSEDEDQADVLNFRKRVVKRKPELATLHIPPTEPISPRPFHMGKRMSYSSASSSSTPPASPLLGPRALYNHTCSKLREAMQSFPISSMPSSTNKSAFAKTPRCLMYTLHRQALLRKLGSPWVPGIALEAAQQREISCFTPRGGRPSSSILSPIVKSLIDFESTSSSTTDTIVINDQSKTVAELRQSPLLKWIERPAFEHRMVEIHPDADPIRVLGRASEKRKFTHVIESQIALHREQAAMAKRLQDKRSSRRFARPMSMVSSPTEISTARLPALNKSMPLPRRAASTPATSTMKTQVKEEDEDEVPLSRLLSPKLSSPVSPSRPTPARSQSATRLSSSVGPSAMPSAPRTTLPRSSSGNALARVEEQGKRQQLRPIFDTSHPLPSSVGKGSTYSNDKRLSQPSASVMKDDKRQSTSHISKQVKEDRRRSTLLQSASTPRSGEKPKARPLSEPNKRRLMADTRRHSAIPSQPLLQEVVVPYSTPYTMPMVSAPFYNPAIYPFLQPIPPSYHLQNIPRSNSFQQHILASNTPQPYPSQPVFTHMPRSWSTSVLTQQ